MAEDRAPIKVEISHKTVIFTISFLIGLWALVQIREIIIVFFFSIIVVAALLKPVEWLTSKKIPRVLSAIIVYILVIAVISLGISLLVPPFKKQWEDLQIDLPHIIATINNFFIFNDIPVKDISTIIARHIENLTGDIVQVTTKIFSSVLLFVTIFILSFYLLLDWDKFIKFIASPFSGKQEKKVINLIAGVEKGLGYWLRGQVALSFIVGILVYIGLTILGIPFAIPLAVIAAVLEIIPIIGPTISSIPAILVGFTISPILGIVVGVLYIIIQQVESNFIAPIIMSKVVGIQPPIVIIALLVGSKIAGVGGAILAIPLVVLIKIIVAQLLVEDLKIEDSAE